MRKLITKIKLKRFEKFLKKLQVKIRNSKNGCYSKKEYNVFINIKGEFMVFSKKRLKFLNKDERTVALMEIYGIKLR